MKEKLSNNPSTTQRDVTGLLKGKLLISLNWIFFFIISFFLFFYFPYSLSFGYDPANNLLSQESQSTALDKTDISFEISYPTEENLITSYQQIFLQGKIQAKNGIRKIELNSQDIFDADELNALVTKNWPKLRQALMKQNLKPEKVRQILELSLKKFNLYHLNQIYSLNDNDNSLILQVEDNLGHKAIKQLHIKYMQLKDSFKIHHRMNLAIIPPVQEAGTDQVDLQDYIYQRLCESFTRQARFNLVERSKLPWLMIEKAIQTKEISMQEIAGQIGHLTSADGVIFLEVQKMNDGIEILAKLVDIKGSILFIHSIFSVGNDSRGHKGFEDLNTAIDGLAMKFRDSIPLLRGTILSQNGSTIQVNLGSEKGIFPGISYNIFKKDGEELFSRALVEKVSKGTSIARIAETEKNKPIKAEYRVSTR